MPPALRRRTVATASSMLARSVEVEPQHLELDAALGRRRAAAPRAGRGCGPWRTRGSRPPASCSAVSRPRPVPLPVTITASPGRPGRPLSIPCISRSRSRRARCRGSRCERSRRATDARAAPAARSGPIRSSAAAPACTFGRCSLEVLEGVDEGRLLGVDQHDRRLDRRRPARASACRPGGSPRGSVVSSSSRSSGLGLRGRPFSGPHCLGRSIVALIM